MKDWEVYEEKIFNKFRREFPGELISKNQKILGRYTNRQRQIDILAESKSLGHTFRVVIECKNFNKKVNVKIVESFLAMLDDVEANAGIMVTNIGYTKGAELRAENDIKKIKLDIVEFSKLDDYHFILDSCQACMHRFILGEISWEQNEIVLKKRPKISILQGCCDSCGSVYYKCCQCGLVIEKEEMNSIECSCGNQFRLTEAYIRHGMTEDRIELKSKK